MIHHLLEVCSLQGGFVASKELYKNFAPVDGILWMESIVNWERHVQCVKLKIKAPPQKFGRVW